MTNTLLQSKDLITEILSKQSGINPKLWGPSFWKTLFYTGLNYPVKVDNTNKCHIALRKHYKMFYCSLQYILPCIFCLESYRRFWKEEDIDKYLNRRIDLLKWLYILKDKVNNKLIQQEKQTFLAEKKKIMEKYKLKYGPQTSWKKTVCVEFGLKIDKLKIRILKTKQSPSLKKAMEYFASLRE